MKKNIKLNAAELQSGLTRVKAAENLILQLPDTHDGRNTWLLNYGISEEAKKLRVNYTHCKLEWDKSTESLKPVN